MKLLVVDNVHLYRDKVGNYYATSVYDYSFLQRYLKVFEEIRFVGKVRTIEKADSTKYSLVSGEGVEIYEIPWYQGMKQLLKKIGRVIPSYKNATNDCTCCIYRIAQVESFLVYLLGGKKLPYAVEMVNDPESWSDMPLPIRWFSGKMARKMIARSVGASFVTENFLQKKYADINKGNNYFTANYSSVEIEDSNIAQEPINPKDIDIFKIIHISNMICDDRKGHKILIEIAKILIDKGYRVYVDFVGDGDKVEVFRNYAGLLGISDRICFVGRIGRKEDLFHKLREANMMVFPSMTEGLPRCLIEAMAVGLPCLSTPVGGIPELLEEKYLFLPDDSAGFANKIIQLLDSPDELLQMSLKNIEKAKEFRKTELELRRTKFYKELREVVQNRLLQRKKRD